MKRLQFSGHYLAVLLLVVVYISIVSDNALAQEVWRIPIVDAPVGTPGLGAGLRYGTGLDGDEDIDDDVIPLYLFEGEYLFAHGTSGGVHVYRNEFFNFDVLASYQFNQLDVDNEELKGTKERNQTIAGGVRLGLKGGWGEMEFQWLDDMLDNHNGQSYDLSYRYKIQNGSWTFTPWVSHIWQDEKITNYYYGVSELESIISGLQEYYPGNAKNYAVGLNTSYQVTKRIFAFANMGAYGVDDEIYNSPLVAEDIAGTLFIGGGYMFGNVYKAEGVPIERENEWSWRISYGYQADGNISTKIFTGDLSGSDNAVTNIAGLTLGKLVLGGPRADFYGRFALYRHLESDYHDDFWSYNPYIMIMGKGFAPWTDRVSFRFGFGAGFSYAHSVPIEEQIKQAKRERDTSKYLNYLEWTADLAVDQFIHAKSARNCYIGITVPHRSGIFGSSDLLDNVAGGSDWISMHLECLR